MLKGLFLGLIFGFCIGCALGWCFRPPSSFPVDELKEAVEEKFGSASDTVREQLAEFSEELARKLREKKENDENQPE